MRNAPPSSTKVARAQRRGSHEGGPAGFAFGWFTVATFDYHEVLLFGIQLLYHYALPDATCYSMLFFYLNYHHWSSLNLNENNYKNGSTFGMTVTWIFLTTSYQLSKPSLPHLGIPSGSGWPSSYVAFIGPTRKPDKGASRESPAMADSG